MKELIKKVLDKNGIMNEQDEIVNELAADITKGGYIHIDRIKLDKKKVVLAVATAMNLLQESNPLIIEG